MPLDFLSPGAQPLPGYECQKDMGGSVYYRLWRMKAPDGTQKMWKAIDLVVGNATVETRNLELLVKLRHPHLNTLTHYHSLPEFKCLIIETDVPHKSLRERLSECKALGLPGVPAAELTAFIQQAADGLDFLNAPRHQFQSQMVAIYHRDLRPESLLLFREEGKLVCKVSDFGLAKPVSEQVAQHSQGLVHFDYDPPEFYEGTTSPTSDQYALSINYYELRCGRLPFQGTMLEQLSARLSDKPDLSGVDEREREVLRRALAK
ncbi:MAG TPA: protein kinase, partial [Planctomycetia bacterium]|nr:protein kinase [Planctomycetia bacterium]